MEGYETVVITDPNLTDEESATALTKFKTLIEKQGGKTEFESFWGRRRLAYEVKKKEFGNYHMLFFTGNGALVDELETQFRYDENIIKYFLIKREDLEDAYNKFEVIKADPGANVKILMEED